jgi:hypothetical protein
MEFSDILGKAFNENAMDTSHSIQVRAAARAVLLVAGLHIQDTISYKLGTVDTLFERVAAERLESNGITNQNPHT